MKQKIIVTPASKWQMQIINALKKKNFYVLSLDDDDNAIGHKFTNKRLLIKTSNIKKIINFTKKNKALIFSSCSDFGQKICNKVTNKSNILFNKYHQRLIQKKLNLNTPFFKKDFLNKNDLKKYKKFICKPLYGSGSNNVSVIENISKNNLIKKGYLFEEYINGKEYNVDGFYFKKKFYLFAIMEKKKIKNSFTVSYIMKSNNLSKKKIDLIKKNINSFFIEMKYPDGPIHAEVIINKLDNQPVIVESHPREAGFDLYYKTCKKITGLNLILNTIDVKLKKNISINQLQSKERFKFFCTRMIPVLKKGKIKKIYFTKIKKSKNVKIYTDLFVSPKKNVEYNSNDASRLGSITCLSNKISNLEKFSKSILKKHFKLEYY